MNEHNIIADYMTDSKMPSLHEDDNQVLPCLEFKKLFFDTKISFHSSTLGTYFNILSFGYSQLSHSGCIRDIML